MTYEELLQEFAQKPYDELVQIGRNSLGAALPKLQEFLKDNQDMTRSYIFSLIGSCIGIDNSLSTLEVQYINDVLGFSASAEDYKNLAINSLDGELIQALDGILDALDDDTKYSLGRFCVCVFAVDQNVARNEVAYIAKLIG